VSDDTSTSIETGDPEPERAAPSDDLAATAARAPSISDRKLALWRRLAVDISPLRESPPYRRWWSGYMVSNIGNQLTIVTAQLQVFRITHSSFDVGLTGLVTVIPLIIFGLFGGAIADAFDRRRVMLVTSSLSALASGVMTLQAATHQDRLSIIYVVLGFQAALFSADSASRGATLPRLIRKDLLAGVIVGSVGYTWSYAIDLMSFSAVLYGVIRLPSIPPDSDAKRPGVKSVAEGFRFLWPRKNLLMTFLVDINAMVFGMPRALFPALALHEFHGGASTAGLLYAAPSVGALLGASMSGWSGRVRRQGLAVLVSVLVWGGSIAAFGLIHVLWIGLILLAVAGAADMVSAIFRNTILQVATPDSLRGRLQGVFIVVVAGGPRFGDVESGTMASLVSTEFSVVSGGLACMVGVAALAALYPSFARYDAKDPIP
jgi:MFS family permease